MMYDMMCCSVVLGCGVLVVSCVALSYAGLNHEFPITTITVQSKRMTEDVKVLKGMSKDVKAPIPSAKDDLES